MAALEPSSMKVNILKCACVTAALCAAWFAVKTPIGASAATETIAATPPMGWNSWDCYGNTVREAEVKANAEYMAKNLKAHGWQYVVVDIQWSEPNPQANGGYRPDTTLSMDANGRLTPAENRFPSAAGGNGFKPLADYVHNLGLKFGIHIMRGIPRRAVKANLPVLGSKAKAADIADTSSVCPWNTDMYGLDMSKPGAQDYYDSLLKLYASWGVDFIKTDDIARPAHTAEIAGLHKAIVKTGRPIVLSLSPGPTQVKDFPQIQANANMWRISDDFWDNWRLLRQNFILMSIWSGVGRPGAWPDADMLPLGRIGLSADRAKSRASGFTQVEQRTLMSLWAIAQSPLIFGGDLPGNDDFTLQLITNDEVLAVNQKGSGGRAFAEGGNDVLWTADALGSNAKYVGVFNVGDRAPITIRVNARALGLPARCAVRDLWEHKDLGELDGSREFQVAPHASGLYKLTPAGR
jgi:alpha-galactosidase